MAAGSVNVRIASGSRCAKSGTFTRSGISASVSGFSAVLFVWMTGSSFSTCCHSNDFVAAVDVEALAILARGVEEAARHLGRDVGVRAS